MRPSIRIPKLRAESISPKSKMFDRGRNLTTHSTGAAIASLSWCFLRCKLCGFAPPQAWLDIGNAAAHGKFVEYSQDDVAKLIEDIERFLATYFHS